MPQKRVSPSGVSCNQHTIKANYIKVPTVSRTSPSLCCCLALKRY
jgi:hypothetical protein